MKKTVVIGMLGINLDRTGRDRWEHWRPTIDLCRQPALVVHRLELLHERNASSHATDVAEDIRRVSPETEVRSHFLEFDNPWDFEQMYATLHDFARAYRFLPEREDYLVHMTTGTHVAQICLFLLAESRHLPARLIQTSPPTRSQRGQPGSYTVIDLDLSKYDRLASRFRRERDEGLSSLKSGIATLDAHFNRLIDRIETVAGRTRAPILLTGPTGAGKSQLARRIYELQRSRGLVSGPLVEINCATLRGDAAMSALFGHVKGAFTGALRDRPGLLRSADGGTLFLDEIGVLGADEQAMLLRALEERSFLPVGADREVHSDFQLIAGTNRDLHEEARLGRFRADLLSRVDLWTFALPSLRERRDDIGPNLDFEIERCSELLGVQVRFSREARSTFLHFAKSPEAIWPANFRDFGGAVLRMATLAEGGRVEVALVRDEIGRLRSLWRNAARDSGDSHEILRRHLDERRIAELDPFDVPQLVEVLRVCEESASLADAGRRLFAVSRQRRRSLNDSDRLRKYLARFGIDWNANMRGASPTT